MDDPLKEAEAYLEIPDMDRDFRQCFEWLIDEVKVLRVRLAERDNYIIETHKRKGIEQWK